MPPPADRTYHCVRFQDAGETDAFLRALQRFLNSPRGDAFVRTPGETQVWASRPVAAGPPEVYLSDGALLATEAGFAPLPAIEQIRGSELPPECVLILDGAELRDG